MLYSDHPRVKEVYIEGLLSLLPLSGELSNFLERVKLEYIDKSESGWKGEGYNFSKTRRVGEETHFKPLESLVNELVDFYRDSNPSSDAAPATLLFRGNFYPKTVRSISSHPDGAFLRRLNLPGEDSDRLIYSYDRFNCPIELKIAVSQETLLDNRRKTFWSMHHILRNDPRRRFTFGLSFEANGFQLYYHDRAAYVISQRLDLQKNWEIFVRIVISLSLSPPVDLGYDSTIRLVKEPSVDPTPSGSTANYLSLRTCDVPIPIAKPRSTDVLTEEEAELRALQARPYDIDVHHDDPSLPLSATSGGPALRTYRTVELLADYGTNVLVGRGTRVWTAHPVVGGKVDRETLVVLKDSWINSDRILEHITLFEVRSSLEEKNDPRLQHFLTCVIAGRVRLPARSDQSLSDTVKCTEPDDTAKYIRRNHRFTSTGHEYPLERLPTVSRQTKGTPTSGTQSEDLGRSISFHPDTFRGQIHKIDGGPRVHYRIVFKEIGTTITNVRTFEHGLFSVQAGLCGVGALHELGYIHRDVSANNILLIARRDNQPHGRCSCEEIDNDMTVPTTCEKYTAVVMDLEYSLKAGEVGLQHELRTGTWHFMASEVRAKQYEVSFKTNRTWPESVQRAILSFKQHALHDVEPGVWISLWFFFVYRPANIPAIADKTTFQAQYKALFPMPGDAAHRPTGSCCATLISNATPAALVHLPRRIGALLGGWYDDLQDITKQAYEETKILENFSGINAFSPAAVTTSFRALRELRHLVMDPSLCGELDPVEMDEKLVSPAD